MIGERGGQLLGQLAEYSCAPFLFRGFWRRFQWFFWCLVIWSQWVGLGVSRVGAAAWAASGSTAGLPVVVGDKGPSCFYLCLVGMVEGEKEGGGTTWPEDRRI